MNKEYYEKQIKACKQKITELQTRVLRFQSYIENEHYPNKRGKKSNKTELNEIKQNKNELTSNETNKEETGYFGI